MNRRLAVAFLLLVVLAGTGAARACDPMVGEQAGHVTVYEGRIGPYPVRVGLQTAPGGAVAGRYGYAGAVGTIRLAGQLAGGRAVTLTEFGGARGAVSGHFVGTWPETKAGPCAMFVGTWTGVAGRKTLPVRLRMSDSSFRDLAYYTSPKALRIERAAVALRAAILAGNRAAVIAAVRYPVFVSVGNVRMHLAAPAALRARYDTIFTPSFRARIRADIPHMMFRRDQGTMLGGGDIWFDGDGRAISINN